jgi:GntR family transcriptional repressor for pyruvate dehydrogenase complex
MMSELTGLQSARTNGAPTLVVQVANRLSARVFASSPGERLPSVEELALEFQVSRTVIREAIKILAAKGLLEARHGDGTYVVDPGYGPLAESMKNLLAFRGGTGGTLALDLMELRAVLDSTAASMAAARATSEDLAAIRRALMRPREVETAGDGEAVMAAQVEFHVAVAHASHNPILALLLEVIAPLSIENQRPLVGRRTEANHHRRIFDAIVSRDRESARALAAEHASELLGELQRSLFAEPETEVRRAWPVGDSGGVSQGCTHP